jgi:hypothetical protein
VRRLTNLVYYWLTQNARAEDRERIDYELTMPLNPRDPRGADSISDWERAFSGMQM